MFAKTDVLLPTDFSHYALYAMRYAIAIARKYGGRVCFAHVLDPALFSIGSGHGYWLTKSDVDTLTASMNEQAEKRLKHLVQMVKDAGVDADYHIVRGRPWVEIVKLADVLTCDMIVIATHGRTGFDHVAFGSVAERVVRHSPVPVLCIKHPEHEFVNDGDLSINIRQVLFPSDFSEYAERTLPYAASICKEFGARLVLFNTSEVPVVLPEFMPDTATTVSADMEDHAREALENMRDQLEGIEVDVKVKTGVAYREICLAVDEMDVDLIVLPTHGKSGIVHLLFGSVAEKVVRLSSCPVLAIRPEGEPADQD